jgi:hypothetical protein
MNKKFRLKKAWGKIKNATVHDQLGKWGGRDQMHHGALPNYSSFKRRALEHC